jgi:hypothetical protein
VWKKVNRPNASTIIGTKQVKRIKGSRRVGNGMDRTITTTVNLQLKNQLDPACFWNSKLAAAHPTRAKQLTVIVQRRNRYVQKFWQVMKMQQLKPIATQVPVRHPSLALGTLVDVVCIDRHGNHRVIEIKTGYDDWKHSSGGSLQAPFTAHNDCPMHQHQLQLACTHYMYQQTFRDKPVGKPLLMRFHSSGVEIVQLAKWTDTPALWHQIDKLCYK